jgi:voltage-gated potassium channel
LADLNNHIIVCGGGYVGKRITHELTKEGEPFAVVEPQEDLMRWTLLYLDEDYRRHRYRESADFTYQMEDSGHEEMEIASLADALGIAYILDTPTNNAILVRAGIERARGVFAVMSDDRDNLLTVLSARALAREMNNPDLRIIARTVEEENTQKLKMAGADRVFSPNFVEATQLTTHMLHPHTGAFWRMTMDETVPLRYAEVYVDADSKLAGMACAQIKKSEAYLVMSIFRDNQYLNLPDPDVICQAGDVLVVLTEQY